MLAVMTTVQVVLNWTGGGGETSWLEISIIKFII